MIRDVIELNIKILGAKLTNFRTITNNLLFLQRNYARNDYHKKRPRPPHRRSGKDAPQRRAEHHDLRRKTH